jgi:hypothetical protein
MQLMDESKMASSSFSTIFDEIFVGARADTESVD